MPDYGDAYGFGSGTVVDTSNRPDWAGSGRPQGPAGGPPPPEPVFIPPPSIPPGEPGGPGYIEPPPVQTTVDTSGGDDTGSGFTSDTTTNPYYTTEGTFIPEQRPLQTVTDPITGEIISGPSALMVGNVIADALANQAVNDPVNPGLALSWDYNINNPDRIGSYENGVLVDPSGNPMMQNTPTLGSIMAVDSSGNPILDSSGNPILTSFGTQIVGDVQQSLAQQGPVDLSLYGALGPTGFWDNIMSPTELSDYQDSFWRDYSAPGGGGGYQDYGWGDYYGDRRDAKMQFLAALEAGPYGKNLEQSGFFNELVQQYHPDEAREALERGIFSGMYGKPGQVGISGEGMKRMIRSYGSGLTSPHYKNIATYAKGGIVGLLGV